MKKRLFDFILSTFVLALLSPILIIIGLIVKSDGGPAIFKQIRVGQGGRFFNLFKFRSMVVGADKMGAKVTAGNDPRITRFGCFLRRTKLDELPQLWNVVLGDISIVGPRPEVPFYVSKWPMEDREIILAAKPGITDYATLLYNDEQAVLSKSDTPEATYLNVIMPHKLMLYKQYLQDHTFILDLKIVAATIIKIAGIDVGWQFSRGVSNFVQTRSGD